MKINNEIGVSYVSLEVSKLLREKEFNVPCNTHYELSLKSREDKEYGFSGPFGWKEGELNIKSDYNTNTLLNNYYDSVNWIAYSRPIIQVAVQWIYENFNIWIEVTMGKDNNSVWFDYDIFSSIKPRKDDELGEEDFEYNIDPNERWLDYKTTYESMIDEKFEIFEKESCESSEQAYNKALLYILTNLI
jgi:hypothetical protein